MPFPRVCPQSTDNRKILKLDYIRRAGWPEEPMFWIANTGFLFVNCQILDPRIKKIQKTLLFWNIFWSPNTGFLFVKRPNFGSKTGSWSLSKNHICEGILTKTGEMSFYLKQLRDTHTRTPNNILRTHKIWGFYTIGPSGKKIFQIWTHHVSRSIQQNFRGSGDSCTVEQLGSREPVMGA